MKFIPIRWSSFSFILDFEFVNVLFFLQGINVLCVCVCVCVYYNHLITINMITTNITMITTTIKITPTTPPIIGPIPPEGSLVGSLVCLVEEEEVIEVEVVIVPTLRNN